MKTIRRPAWMVVLAVATALAVFVAAAVVSPRLFSGAKRHLLRTDTSLTVTSPGQTTSLILTVRDGRLTYRIERDGTLFMSESPLGVTLGSDTYGMLASMSDIGRVQARKVTEQRNILGRTATADDPCIAAVIAVEGDAPFELEVRVFDNGAAFRYRLPDGGHRALHSEETGFVVPADTAVWAGESHCYYESAIQYRDPAKVGLVSLGTPATLKIGDLGYAAVLEANLNHYPGLKLAWQSPRCYTADLGDTTPAMSGEVLTPWRIIAVADDLNELVNNTILYQLCDPADPALFGDDWVRPGRATWSWITERTTDAVTPDVMADYTDYAAQLGFEYNIIDEGWINWNNAARKLDDLVARGESVGVGQILWTGVQAGASFGGGIDSAEDAYAFLDYLEEHGLAGGKIDFFPEEDTLETGVDIYRDILEYAAQKHLVINFHGCNKPTGLDVTFPNELNREAILGLESTSVSNRRVQAQMFVTQPFVRNLAGHADFTPAVESAFHMAQLVLTDAPMQAIGSHPEDILKSPALEMIKSVPTVWNQTVVLPQSRIGQAAVIARQSQSGSWFVGGINNTASEEDLTLDLSAFLGDGTYRMELWTDRGQRPVCEVDTVTAAESVTVPFAALSGFILRLDRVTLSQYGGAYTEPITVEIADPDTAVSYCFQGDDGRTAFTPIASGETITLHESGVLTLKVTGGPDRGKTASYRFNLITP